MSADIGHGWQAGFKVDYDAIFVESWSPFTGAMLLILVIIGLMLAAALIHDVGKILSPLSILDRVLIVLGQHFLPRAARRWGEGEARGWRRPFVVAARHAAWGADLAEQAGASGRTVRLIRRHQDSLTGDTAGEEDRLLADLHAADEAN